MEKNNLSGDIKLYLKNGHITPYEYMRLAAIAAFESKRCGHRLFIVWNPGNGSKINISLN